MISNGHHLVCAVSRRQSNRQASLRYNQTAKGQARLDRYEQTRIRTRFAGTDTSYRVPAKRKAELVDILAGFRAQQKATHKEASSGGFHQAIA